MERSRLAMISFTLSLVPLVLSALLFLFLVIVDLFSGNFFSPLGILMVGLGMFAMGFMFLGFLSVIAIILGVVALSSIKKGKYGGKKFAVWGIVIGGASVILAVLSWVFFIIRSRGGIFI